jgi:hypothetical protein
VGEWQVRCFVTAYEEGRAFGWSVVDPDDPGARWRFDVEQMPGGTRLRFLAKLGPGPSGTTAAMEAMPDAASAILGGRLREVQANMERTVHGIKELAEARAAESGPGAGSGDGS